MLLTILFIYPLIKHTLNEHPPVGNLPILFYLFQALTPLTLYQKKTRPGCTWMYMDVPFRPMMDKTNVFGTT